MLASLRRQRMLLPQLHNKLTMSPRIARLTEIRIILDIFWDCFAHAMDVLPYVAAIAPKHVASYVCHHTTDAADTVLLHAFREVVDIEEFWHEIWSLAGLARTLCTGLV